jgi:hypothetical protein
MHDNHSIPSLLPMQSSLLHYGLMLFSTPHNTTEHSKADFDSDTAWFKSHKERHQVIRAASFAEFNVWENRQQCGALHIPAPPKLWVLVMRSGTSNHIIIPIYLGEKCFPIDNTPAGYDTCDTDDALQVILYQLNAYKGIEPTELAVWMEHLRTAAKQAAAQQTGVVH